MIPIIDDIWFTPSLFVINHSVGKDSQAMMIKLLEFVPKEQILVVHASLGFMEWPGAMELARDQAAAAGVDFIVTNAKSFRREQARDGQQSSSEWTGGCGKEWSRWWSSEPELGRVANGVAHRVDRLKTIGNGQVPIVAKSAFRYLGGASYE